MQHDARFSVLLEMTNMSIKTLNPKRFTFKSQDCPSFGHILTLKGLMFNSLNISPDNLRDIQSFIGIKYPNKY